MNYMIHQKGQIDPKHQQDYFDREAQKKLKLLDKVLSGYRKSINLNMYVGKTSTDEYQISVSLPMRSKLLYLEDKGYQPVLLINQLLDKLRTAVKEQLKIERKERLRKRKVRQQQNLQAFVSKLEEQYLENEEEAFKHLLLQVIPSLKGYISRRLQMAEATTLLKSKTLRLDELVDEVCLKIYDRFLQKPANEQELLPWIYRIADEVISSVLHEKEFETEHLLHLELLAAHEYQDLKEKFTVDADGDLVMIEELDDPSYQISYYEPEVVLEDKTDAEILEKISAQYDTKAFHEEISKILATQSSLHRTVFDLFWLEQFTTEEIAEIKSVRIEEVRKILEDISTLVLKHLRHEPEYR